MRVGRRKDSKGGWRKEGSFGERKGRTVWGRKGWEKEDKEGWRGRWLLFSTCISENVTKSPDS